MLARPDIVPNMLISSIKNDQKQSFLKFVNPLNIQGCKIYFKKGNSLDNYWRKVNESFYLTSLVFKVLSTSVVQPIRHSPMAIQCKN